MRRVGLMMVTVVLSGALAACGGDNDDGGATPSAESTPTATATATAAEETPVEAATEAATETPAPEEAADDASSSTDRPDKDGDGSPDTLTFRGKTGDTFTLVGQPGFEKAAKNAVKVTVTGVTGPFDGFDLDPGRQLIGVTVEFEGVGKKPYYDPQPTGTLSLSTGETGEPTSLITTGGSSPCDAPSLRLSPGEKKDACLAFEVAKKGKPKVFEYAADSGFGDKGIWKVK